MPDSAHERFLRSLGFNDDPFASSNAEKEKHIDSYFVPPPYFESLWGAQDSLRSHVIFAPRGFGKTAQRVIMERRAATNNVLAVAYDDFRCPGFSSLEQADLTFHFKNITRATLKTFFRHLPGYLRRERAALKDLFSPADAEFIHGAVDLYLNGEETEEIRTLVKDSMDWSGKIKEWWNKNLPMLSFLGNVTRAKVGLPNGTPEQFERNLPGDAKSHFKKLLKLSMKLGFRCCFILVDKVDETTWTNGGRDSASKSYQLVSALLRSVEDLDGPTDYAFKFFLWDSLETFYHDDARSDRVRQFHIDWRYDELLLALERRLKAYSDRRIKSLNDITESCGLDVDRLVIVFSNYSPRNMIQIIDAAVAEHVRLEPYAGLKLALDDFDKAIKQFSVNYVKQYYSKPGELIKDLRRVGAPAFAPKEVEDSPLRAPIETLQDWEERGIVKRTCTLKRRQGQPTPYYMISDVALVPLALDSTPTFEAIRNMALCCSSCRRMYFVPLKHEKYFGVKSNPLCPHCDSKLLRGLTDTSSNSDD